MLKVLLPTRMWDFPRVRHALVLSLSLALYLFPMSARAQTPPDSKKAAPDSSKSQKSGPAATGGQSATTTPGKTAVAPDVAAPAAAPVGGDPSQTRKIAPIEIFRDKRAEAVLDLSKLKPVVARPVTNAEILQVQAQAADPNANMDKNVIKQVVDAMAAKLTDRSNVQALVDPPANLPPTRPATRGVQEATTALLVPLFGAKSIKNQAFLAIYYRALRDALTPLLKNHLIPRVQAMIILGEAGIRGLLAALRSANQGS